MQSAVKHHLLLLIAKPLATLVTLETVALELRVVPRVKPPTSQLAPIPVLVLGTLLSRPLSMTTSVMTTSQA